MILPPPPMTIEGVLEVVKIIGDRPRFKYGLLSVVVGGAALRFVIWTVYPYIIIQSNIKRRQKRVNERKRSVRETSRDVQFDEIVSKDIKDLRKCLLNRRLRVETVLKAFQRKALRMDDKFNLVTEPVLEALERARHLDRSSTKEGQLFGIPVSIKECIALAGYDRTGGMAFMLDELETEDAVVVKVLKKSGAIPFVRTNIPQTMMSYCSSNHIYGETLNPHDITRTPGGSSSGEGALIGGGGCFIGIGTDIGGSIRIPAAFCGCYSLKPTSQRISNKGAAYSDEGSLPIVSCACPIAIDMQSLVFLCKVLMSDTMYELDPHIPYLPFNNERLKRPAVLRVGYFVYDGNVRCQPPVVRAVMESKAALEMMGHQVIPVTISDLSPSGYNAADMHSRLVIPDRCRGIRRALATERHVNSVRFLLYLTLMPTWLLRALSYVVSFVDKNAAQTLRAGIGFGSLDEYLEHVAKFKRWREYFTEAWTSMELDAVICPVFPSVIPKREWMHLLTSAGVYCLLFNSLDYPSGVMPVTTVTKVDIRNTMNPKFYAPSQMVERILMKSVAGSEGLPVAIQCAALPYREETCLRVMKEVENGLSKKRKMKKTCDMIHAKLSQYSY